MPHLPATTLETPRLQLRALSPDDAPFLVRLMNDPGWLTYIGDRGVHNENDARNYMDHGPDARHQQTWYSLYRVGLPKTDEAIGLCSLIQRSSLPAPDLGFAFLPAHRGQGYASEACRAVIEHARSELGVQRLLAIAMRTNVRSLFLLERLGFRQLGAPAAGSSSGSEPGSGSAGTDLITLELVLSGC